MEKSFEEKQEEDFCRQCEALAYYQGEKERITIDGEWTESELEEDILDEAEKRLKEWLPKNKNRLLIDENLTHSEFIVNDILERYDIIEEYNKAYDKHRNDKPMKFGICYFDEFVTSEVNKILKNNLATK